MNTREIKKIDFEVKVNLQPSDGGGLAWEGYVAAFDNADSYDDVIIRGAFDDDEGKTIPAFFEHTIHAGKMFVVGQDSYGLKVRGELAPDEIQDPRVGSLSARLRWLMAENNNVGEVNYSMSIGYYTVDAEAGVLNGKSVRFLKKLKLVEGSLVLNPANEKAIITDYKSAETLTLEKIESMTERELESALKSGISMSNGLSKTVVSLFKKEQSNNTKSLMRIARVLKV